MKRAKRNLPAPVKKGVWKKAGNHIFLVSDFSFIFCVIFYFSSYMPEHIRNNFAKEDGDYRLSHSPCLKIILYFIDSSCFHHTCTSLRLILKIVFWVAGGWAWRGVWFHSVWLYCHIYLRWGNVGPYTAFKRDNWPRNSFEMVLPITTLSKQPHS